MRGSLAPGSLADLEHVYSRLCPELTVMNCNEEPWKADPLVGQAETEYRLLVGV